MKSTPERTWNLGYILLLIAPFVGLIVVLIEVPWWLNLVVAGVIIALVFFGTKLLFRSKGGWRPSQTLPEPHRDDEP